MKVDNFRYEDVKQWIRKRSYGQKRVGFPVEGERVPVDGLEASKVAADYLNLRQPKINKS